LRAVYVTVAGSRTLLVQQSGWLLASVADNSVSSVLNLNC